MRPVDYAAQTERGWRMSVLLDRQGGSPDA